jgi:1,5-anhydro-D-fructose reductase (1,5-anhydro-D-mannitol-forming)
MESVLNWVVVGIGDITSKRVIPAIQAEPRSRLWGVVSRDPAKAARYAARVWTSLEEALRDPAIEAVYVATPVFLHAPLAIAALRAGRHVLCEKPTAMNYAEALEMVRTGREAGRLFGVAYYRRMYPKLHRARELLAAGAIGRPVLAEINCHGWLPAQDGARSWLLDPRQAGGGPLYDIGSHRIDVLNFLFGKPIAVAAQLSNAVHQTAVEDNATVLIEYQAGLRGVVDVRWHSRVARDGFRIVGTDGEMDLNPLNGPALVYPGGAEELPCSPNVHYPCVENFVGAVLDGALLASSGESSLWTDWVMDQARRVRPSAGDGLPRG